MAKPGIDAEALAHAIVMSASEMISVIDNEARVVAVNGNTVDQLGYEPDDLFELTAFDLLDPVDHPRAHLLLDLTSERGAPLGNASFALRRADGSVVPTQLTGCDVTLGGDRYVAFIGRPSYMVSAVETVLDELLAGATLTDVLAPILEFFAWRENRSEIAIAWFEGGEIRSVGTGLPIELSGQDTSTFSPWERVRQGGTIINLDTTDLPGHLAPVASRAGLRRIRIEPVAAAHLEVPATITVWTSDPGLAPEVHAFAISTASRYIEMALRWTDQVSRLNAAANHDPLTYLANRRAFFSAIGTGDRAGAVLYCDLDGFKAVNDRWGHATGDALLRVIGQRIVGEVRDGDLVARLGGDEFAVLLWDASLDAARETAERLRLTCRHPVAVDGVDDTIEVGLSVGVAHDPGGMTEATVERADQELYREKHLTRVVRTDQQSDG